MNSTEHDLRAALAEWARDRPVLDEVRPRLQPRRRNGRLMIGAAAGVAAVAIGVSAAVGSFTDDEPADRPPVPLTAVPSNPTTGTCFGEVDLDTGLKAQFAFATADSSGPIDQDISEAIQGARDICAWHEVGGTFVPDISVKSLDGPIPAADPSLALAVCVLADGSIGIFAGADSVCGDLGLSVAVAAPGATTTTG